MTVDHRQHLAIVPAAGMSRRMGQPKLLLPWGNGRIIDQVLRAWTGSQVDCVAVVVRPGDDELIEACRRWPVEVVQPDHEPADMKESIQIGISFLQETKHPREDARCFMAPADLPSLQSQIIDRLVGEPSDGATIVVPRFGERRGHPVLVPWRLTNEVFELAEDEGVNRIVQRHANRMVSFPADQLVTDVDTPEEYQAARRAAGDQSS